MSTTPATISPEMASVMADALRIAIRRTSADHANHSRRVAEAHARALRGEATATDRGTIETAENVRIGIETMHEAQETALDLMIALGGTLDPATAAATV